MSLYDALRTILLANADVTDLVGDRIYGKRLPHDPTFPAITRDGISGLPWQGNSSRTLPLEGTVVQFSCWAESESKSINLARKVAECLQSYSGTSDGVTIGAALVRSSPDAGTDYELDTGLYMTPIDVLVRYEVTS